MDDKKNLTWHKIKYLDYGYVFIIGMLVIIPAFIIVIIILSNFHGQLPFGIFILSVAIQFGAGTLFLLASQAFSFKEAWIAFDENGFLISYPGIRNSFNPDVHEHTEFSQLRYCYWRNYRSGRKWQLKFNVKSRWDRERVIRPFDDPKASRLPDFFAEMKSRVEEYNRSSAAGSNQIITEKVVKKWNLLAWILLLIVVIAIVILVFKLKADKFQPIAVVFMLLPKWISELVDASISYGMKGVKERLKE